MSELDELAHKATKRLMMEVDGVAHEDVEEGVMKEIEEFFFKTIRAAIEDYGHSVRCAHETSYNS